MVCVCKGVKFDIFSSFVDGLFQGESNQENKERYTDVSSICGHDVVVLRRNGEGK